MGVGLVVQWVRRLRRVGVLKAGEAARRRRRLTLFLVAYTDVRRRPFLVPYTFVTFPN